jgi:hypothetical protein
MLKPARSGGEDSIDYRITAPNVDMQAVRGRAHGRRAPAAAAAAAGRASWVCNPCCLPS